MQYRHSEKSLLDWMVGGQSSRKANNPGQGLQYGQAAEPKSWLDFKEHIVKSMNSELGCLGSESGCQLLVIYLTPKGLGFLICKWAK